MDTEDPGLSSKDGMDPPEQNSGLDSAETGRWHEVSVFHSDPLLLCKKFIH